MSSAERPYARRVVRGMTDTTRTAYVHRGLAPCVRAAELERERGFCGAKKVANAVSGKSARNRGAVRLPLPHSVKTGGKTKNENENEASDERK